MIPEEGVLLDDDYEQKILATMMTKAMIMTMTMMMMMTKAMMMMMMRGKRRDLGSSGAWNGPASQKFHYIQLISFPSNALESTLHFIINVFYILSYNIHTFNISLLQIYLFHPFHYRYTGHTLHFIMQHVWCNKLNFHSSKVVLPWRTRIENCFLSKSK